MRGNMGKRMLNVLNILRLNRVSMALFVVMIISISSFGFVSTAKAETVTCAGTETINSNSGVHYDVNTNTCTIDDNSNASAVGLGSINFTARPSLNSEFFSFGIGSSSATVTTQIDCTIGGISVAAGVMCNISTPVDGNETASASTTKSNGDTVRLDISYTIAGGNTTFDITSATVTITAAASSSSTSLTTALRSLQSSISRSQSAVIGKNVGARLAAASDSGNDSGDGDRQQPSSTSFAPTLGFSQTDQIEGRSTSRGATMRDIAMLASFDSSKMVLVAAGDQQDPLMGVQGRSGLPSNQPYTVWGHGSFTSVDNTRNRTNDDSRMNGDVWGYNMGVDYRYRTELVAGVSLGYSETDLTTTFNSGTYKENNWTVSPYAMYQPMDGVTVSAIAGYSIGNVDRTRDTTVTGDTDSGMWFASLNGDYKLRPSAESPLDITARVAVLISRKTVDAFTESDGTAVVKSTTDTRQLKPGLEAAYSFVSQGATLQPFIKTDYIHDFTDATNGDKGAMNFGGGLRMASGQTGLSGSLEGERMVGRSDYKEYTVSGLIAYGFGVGGDSGNTLGIASPYVKTNFNGSTADGQTGSQVFGTGLKFVSDSGAFNAELGLTHSITGLNTAETAGQIRAELKF